MDLWYFWLNQNLISCPLCRVLIAIRMMGFNITSLISCISVLLVSETEISIKKLRTFRQSIAIFITHRCMEYASIRAEAELTTISIAFIEVNTFNPLRTRNISCCSVESLNMYQCTWCVPIVVLRV
jgi:hypothetical protein